MEKNRQKERRADRLRRMLLLLSVVFLALGVFRGEVETVLTKATRICMECIGIG